MIKPLPHWVLTNRYPAINDSESATAIEMVARVYGKTEELIADYNEFVDRVNQTIIDYQNEMNENFDEFRNQIIETMNDYIDCIDMKIDNQDRKIEEAIQYMKDNIVATVTQLFEEAIQEGTIQASLGVDYNAQTEELTFSIVAEEVVEESEGE